MVQIPSPQPLWRRSLAGYSGRFIPGRALVRVRPPLPLSSLPYLYLSFRLLGQAVKTSPFHGGNTSSILVGVTIPVNRVREHSSAGRASALQAEGHRFEPYRSHSCIVISDLDGFPSGQRGQTVNLLQIASVVRIHLHPFPRRDARKGQEGVWRSAGMAE